MSLSETFYLGNSAMSLYIVVQKSLKNEIAIKCPVSLGLILSVLGEKFVFLNQPCTLQIRDENSCKNITASTKIKIFSSLKKN